MGIFPPVYWNDNPGGPLTEGALRVFVVRTEEQYVGEKR